jgi:hypothetical protein
MELLVNFEHPVFVLQWRGVIVLCLCELSAGFPADLERQQSNIVLVGGDTVSVDLDVIEGKQQRNGMYILGAIGQGNLLHTTLRNKTSQNMKEVGASTNASDFLSGRRVRILAATPTMTNESVAGIEKH